MGLSKKEERFIREWTFQRSGSRVAFILMYTLGWTIIFHLTGIVLSYFLTVLDSKVIDLIIGIAAAFLVGFLITLVMYYRNECKFLRLLQKRNESGEEAAS
jgi:phosphotransferase system  glucose/maltose/N-acetylglucosamine-specific IIC component